LLITVSRTNTVVSNHFHSVKILLFSSARSRDFDGMHSTRLRCQCTQQKLQSICAVLTFDPQLKRILTFSVKDIYQLNYFICIKDLNTETITSLKLNLFSFFICCSQHHETKTICLYIFLISDRYWGTEHQYLFSRFLGVSILQLLIIYSIYEYEMLTLSQ
jgi:hypothetical protein